jgi:hypothetical protein
MSLVHNGVRLLTAIVLGGALAVAVTPVRAGAEDTRPTAVVSLGDSAISGEGAGV